jgi:hypothetical protein
MTFERNPEAIQPEVRVFGANGPSRLTHLDSGGYGGSYVCQGCGVPVDGVYCVEVGLEVARNWICAACRTSDKAKIGAQSKTSGEEPRPRMTI